MLTTFPEVNGIVELGLEDIGIRIEFEVRMGLKAEAGKPSLNHWNHSGDGHNQGYHVHPASVPTRLKALSTSLSPTSHSLLSCLKLINPLHLLVTALS